MRGEWGQRVTSPSTVRPVSSCRRTDPNPARSQPSAWARHGPSLSGRTAARKGAKGPWLNHGARPGLPTARLDLEEDRGEAA